MADTKKPDPDSDVDRKIETPVAEDAKPIGDPVEDDSRNEKADSQANDGDPVDKPEATEQPAEIETPEDKPVSDTTSPDNTTRRGGFAPALIGGVLAASLGFLAARTEILDPILPGALKSNGTAEAMAALQDADAKQAEALAALRAEIAAFDQPDLAPLNAQLSTLQAEIASSKAEADSQRAHLRDLEARLVSLDTRVEELEKRPMTEGASDEAIAAYDRELAALRDAIAAQRADVEKMIDEARATEAAARILEENAATAARHARNQAIVARLHSAVNSGAPYGATLAELVSAGVAVPDALNVSANTGVATLAALNDAFPSAARAALAAVRAQGDKGGGITGFLQRQLGARSVEPREGDDPDAILSRAEAAVTGGDLAKAIEEIAALPDEARAAMQGWVDKAATRLTALQAADELAQSLNTN